MGIHDETILRPVCRSSKGSQRLLSRVTLQVTLINPFLQEETEPMARKKVAKPVDSKLKGPQKKKVAARKAPSPKGAKKKAASKHVKSVKKPDFQGRIVRSPVTEAMSVTGVKAARAVLFPKSQADVAAAVSQSQAQRLLVRSGTQAAAESDRVDAAGAVVINLAELSKVSVTDGTMKAEVAATAATMADHLVEKGFALPLGNNPEQSIVANALQEGPSCLMRTLGPLSNYVSSVKAVSPVGRAMTFSAAPLQKSRDSSAVITQINFTPVPAKNLWMFRRTFPYPGKESFARLIRSLLVGARIPAKSDLVLDAFTARYDLPFIRITAAGSDTKDRTALTKLVNKALSTLSPEMAQEIIPEKFTDSKVIKAVVDAGFGIPRDSQIESHRVHSIVGPQTDQTEFLDLVVADVDRGLAFRDDQKGKVDKDFRIFTRLQLNRESQLELSGIVYSTRRITTTLPSPLASLAPAIRAEMPFARGLEGFPEGPPRIPGFKGDVFIPSDWSYWQHAQQYATSSFPAKAMTPHMVAYPLDTADIKSAIRFAKAQKKSIVARSGGHQYCGMSSGDDGTIVLSMEAFNQFHQINANTFDVGPAVQLTRLATEFKLNNVTIPHGECPLVCIGGHAQTGGFGHLIRGFGLALDWVVAMTIVLADGTERTISRPAGPPATDDEELFWGVLGGNAGSFGIVTNYRFECVTDNEHPHSYGYSAIRKYDKACYRGLMKQVQLWTQGVEAGLLPAGIDFMMTVESGSDLIIPPVILVELVHSNLGGENEPVDGDQVFKSVIEAADAAAGFFPRFTEKGPQSLSSLSDSFVRRWPMTTLDGREFQYPFKKRINCTSNALTDVFIHKFVELVNKVVMNTEGVYLVFQMLVGGGNYKNSTRRPQTSIPRRDYVYCFVFDLFYDDGYEQVAVDLQSQMQSIVDHDYSPGQEQRMHWGSFGDIDMSKAEVRDCYYDDLAKYARLQQLKKKVDPGNVFHTPFMVQLP